MGSAPAPVYTAAVTTTPSATHTTAPSFTPPTAATQGPSYGGMEGDSDDNQLNGAPTGHPAPPRYYKLEFPTFDGGVDPLNWLNQCEPFFCGQRTLASDRTWLASYHLRGVAQTWYYALEQDEGMPSWEGFRNLCVLTPDFGTCQGSVLERRKSSALYDRWIREGDRVPRSKILLTEEEEVDQIFWLRFGKNYLIFRSSFYSLE